MNTRKTIDCAACQGAEGLPCSRCGGSGKVSIPFRVNTGNAPAGPNLVGYVGGQRFEGDTPADLKQVTRDAAGHLGTGVPVDVARTLLRQAELFEQLFGLHDVLDVAYVADTLRVAAGLAPIHDGPTSQRSAELELRRQVALGLLQDVERLAAGGYTARVRILHDELEVSALEVHQGVAAAVDQVEAEALRQERDRLLEERDTLRAELLEERNRTA